MRIKNVYNVGQWRLCLGCGACVHACPQNKVTLVDVVNDGIRPILGSEPCGACHECLKVCPGISVRQFRPDTLTYSPTGGSKRWGSILEVWEGYAIDPEIRYHGSSGGIATALSLLAIESGQYYGVLHTAASKRRPWRNRTTMSLSRADLKRCSGSRYSPASPCDGFDRIEEASKPCVFIGKPCDVTGLRKMQFLRPQLKKNAQLAIGFFCAGTPSTQGTLDFLNEYKVKLEEVAALRYRGKGWPGTAEIVFKSENRLPVKVSYKESWGFVQKYRPFRCYLCPDLTAEFADISVGDPWYRELSEDEKGQSLILIRTEAGRRFFHQALEAGYVKARQADPELILLSQRNLLHKRQAIWGRLAAMRIASLPVPELEGFSLFANWLDLSLSEKLRSLFGTLLRVIKRNYLRPLNY